MHGTFSPAGPASTLGASFVSKKSHDSATGATVRLQIWDTAGQERFRALSALYYRGCAALLLVYSITDARSFADMGAWLREVRSAVPEDVIVHVVGTKADVVAQDPAAREVPFERCIAYVAANLHPGGGLAGGTPTPPSTASAGGGPAGLASADNSKRGSGLWAIDAGWDVCHEVSSSSGEGIDEVFRVVVSRIAQSKTSDAAKGQAPGGAKAAKTPGVERRGGSSSYFDRWQGEGSGTIKLGGDKRRSWLLGFPTPNIDNDVISEGVGHIDEQQQRSRCC